jgi:hypothetical protein
VQIETRILTTASLLLILLLTSHLADDIVYGYEKGGLTNLAVVPVVVVWLHAALLLRERRSGYIITLLLSLLGLVVPVIHMKGSKGVGLASRLANSSGHFFFVWTLIAIGVTALFSIVLCIRGLWNLRQGKASA